MLGVGVLVICEKCLCAGCEDVIVENLCVENVVHVMAWAREHHGSQWVARHALHLLTEDFLQLTHSPVLLDLPKDCLKDVLASDFLQVHFLM